MKNTKKLALSILPEKLGICHFDKNSLIPDWALEKTNFTSITRTFGATRNRGLTPANTFTQICLKIGSTLFPLRTLSNLPQVGAQFEKK